MAQDKKYQVNGNTVTVNDVKTRITTDDEQTTSVVTFNMPFSCADLPAWAIERLVGKMIITVQGNWRRQQTIPETAAYDVTMDDGRCVPAMTQEQVLAQTRADVKKLMADGMTKEQAIDKLFGDL